MRREEVDDSPLLTGWGLLAVIAIFIAYVVLARAIEPVLKAVGLVVGFVRNRCSAVAAALAFCAAIFAGLARWAGWNTVWAPSDDVESLHFAMVGLGVALGAALMVAALFAHRLWHKKRDDRNSSLELGVVAVHDPPVELDQILTTMGSTTPPA